MRLRGWITLALLLLLAVWVFGCGSDEIPVKDVLAQPKTYVGSEQCKVCHLEHYDSWKTTLHSRTLQNVTVNRDALITDINPEVIEASLEKNEKGLKLPADKIYIPKVDEIKYTMGVQWRQRYVVEKRGTLYTAPIEYNAWNHEWNSYHEADWEERPWLKNCGGCHATGVDLEKGTFSEAAVGCESCHGPGSHHVALPKTDILDKRMTIINPSKLPAGIRTQICGSCHGKGESTRVEGVDWAAGFLPGRALGPYLKLDPNVGGEIMKDYVSLAIDDHHMQYNDWQQSVHAKKGVSCTSCHYVHQLGLPPTQFQTVGAGSGQCLACHTGNINKYAHSIHSFSNCIGCHMPRITKTSETGGILRHNFKVMTPEASVKAGGVDKQPNACSACHHHKNTPLEELVGFLRAAEKRDTPLPFSVHRRPPPTEKEEKTMGDS